MDKDKAKDKMEVPLQNNLGNSDNELNNSGNTIDALQKSSDNTSDCSGKTDPVGKEFDGRNTNTVSETSLGDNSTEAENDDSGHKVEGNKHDDSAKHAGSQDQGVKIEHKGPVIEVSGNGYINTAYKPDETVQTDSGTKATDTAHGNPQEDEERERGESDKIGSDVEGKKPRDEVGKTEEGESDNDEGGPCKWLSFTPACCQKFRNPKWVLFILCWASGIQGMIINGFVNVVITTIEKRFGISSTESGTVVSTYDIASAICLLPVSYFGGLGVKPRYVSLGMAAVGVGAFLFGLPRFTTGLYTFDFNQDILCNVNSNVTVACDSTFSGSSISNYKYLFICAMLIMGAGASPFYTLGVTYLDDSLPKSSSSLYLGIFYSMNIFGTAIGYLAGGEFLKIWTDVGSVELSSITVSPDNRKWVGAWWLGFILSGGFAIVAAVPMAGFPKDMPGTKKYRKEKATEVYSRKRTRDENTKDNTTAKLSLKRVRTSVKHLLTNPTFIFVSLTAATEAMVVAGFSTFTPKFLEAKFSQTSANAAQYVGYAAIPAGGGATILGGYLVKRFNPRVSQILKACIISCVTVLILLLIFLVQCDTVPFAGINVQYNNPVIGSSIAKNLDDTCNTNCDCTEDDYHPVCGRNGVVYFSPCYAGCETRVPNFDTRYNNCTCVSTTATDYMAEFTNCESQCSLMPPFLVVFAIMMFSTFVIAIPGVTVTLRCVHEEDRNLAMGVQYVALRCLGSIPGPIIFGRMIDLSCLLWQKRCDGEGACFFYDNNNLSYYLMSIGIVVKCLSTLFFTLALVFYKNPASKLNQVEDVPPPKMKSEDKSITLTV